MNDKGRNTRILTNTILLYIRSGIVLILSLYTTRVVLDTLGILDYGLYNVVGGVAALFSFLRTSMTKSTQRFLNVDMVNPNGDLNKTFCASLTIHIAFAIIALFLAETIGLYFMNNYIQIPTGREFAANVIYQSTIISLVLTIVSVPYTADVIAHEDMGYLALVSIVDAVLRLFIAFVITWGNIDNLIMYGLLMAGVPAINYLMYYLFCKAKYVESRYRLMINNDISKIKEILGYTTWTIVGQAAIIGTNQGNNMMMNIFHSVTANASMGVAQQVNGAITTLTSNFQTAFNPQITKAYALKDYEYLKNLVFTTSKFSYILLVTASLPIIFNISWILNVWLDKVPQYAAEFCILVFCNTILNALGAPFNFTVLSSGKIKWFQIFTSFAFLSDLIILYPLFLCGYPAVTALIVKVFSMVLVTIVRVYFAHRIVETINLRKFFSHVLIPLLFSTVLSVFFGLFIFQYAKTLFTTLIATLTLMLFSVIFNLFVSLTKAERGMLIRYAIIIMNKIKNV